jgi:ligand-binding sensor domain-containing protein/HPt (histidine-containing phosphotransfer) domain-containing protein
MKKYHFKSVFILIVLFCTFSTVTSQNNEFMKFTNLSVENGLSVSVVAGFAQDQNGLIWIATQDGLNRYDGYNFKVYYNEPGKEKTLSQNGIRSVAVDKFGNIWAAQNNGVDVLNPSTDEFTNYKNIKGNKNSLSHNTVLDIVRAPNGDMWVATIEGLNQFDYKTKTFKSFINDTANEASIVHSRVHHIFFDSDNTMWLATRGGLSKFNTNSQNFKNYVNVPNDDFSMPPSNNLSRLTEDRAGKLWLIYWVRENDQWLRSVAIFDKKTEKFSTFVNTKNLFAINPSSLNLFDLVSDHEKRIWLIGGNSGLYRYDEVKKDFINYKKDDLNLNSLTANRVQTIFVDRSNLLYVGTFGGGFSKVRYAQNKHFTHFRRDPSTTNTLIGTNILGLLEQRDGTIWAGSIGQGLTKYEPKKDKYTQYFNDGSKNDKMSSNTVTSTLEDNNGNVWLGTGQGLMRYLSNKDDFETTLINDPTADAPFSATGTGVNDILLDKDNNIWLATNRGLALFDGQKRVVKKFYAADSAKNTPTNRSLTRLAEGPDGVIWIGTRRGFERFDRFKEEFSLFRNKKDDPNSLSFDNILSMHVTKENIVWIGSNNGLNRFDYAANKFERFGVKEGLPNSVIYGVLEDNDGNLWITTNVGLSKFNYSKKEFRNFSDKDGLQSNEHNYNSYHKGPSGKIYIGGVNGFNVFDPETVILNETEPIVIFTEFKVNYQDYELENGYLNLKELELAYNENTISFEMAALELTIPQKNKYQYMLEGFDDNWITVSSDRRFITYTNLSPDDYVLKIKAANHDGVWSSQVKSIPVIVVPHFTQTLWFRITVVMLLIIGVVLAFYLKNKIEKRRQELLEQEVRDRTKELSESKDDLEKENDIRKQTEHALLKARGETDAILTNVSEGLFLLDKNLIISDQHSKELEQIFEERNLSKFEFVELMRPLITAKNLEALRDFVELLFNPDIDEEVVNELNPLDQIEVHFEEDAGKFNTKFLEFLFRRIRNEEDQIYNLLVTVRDVSEIIELQRELDESRRKNQYEMQQLLSILRVEPTMLRNFLKSVRDAVQQITTTFKRDEDKSQYHNILKTIYRDIHNLKGNAGLLDLKFFVDKLHSVEEIIGKLMEQEQVAGDDFLPIIFEFDELMKYMSSMEELIDRVLSMSQKIKKGENVETEFLQDAFIESVNDIIMRMGKDLNKQAKLVVENDKGFEIPTKLQNAFKDIIIQLVRNSMVHGIETTEERRSHNKDDAATLKLSVEESNGKFTFKYRDDGKGLDIEKIKEKAFSTGKFDKDKLDAMTNSEIARLIFNDGLSTAEQADEHAGRGEGMSVIKDIVQKNKGKMKFSFANGKFFEMGFELPVAN